MPGDKRSVTFPFVTLPGGQTVYGGNRAALTVNVNDARQPFSTEGTCQGTGNGCIAVIHTVPAGKRLVIEYVSAAITSNAPGEIYRIDVHEDPGFVTHFLPSLPPSPAGTVIQTSGQSLRLYVEPTRNVQISIRRQQSTTTFFAEASFSGYLVDVP